MKRIILTEHQLGLIFEEVVADGSANHNPYRKRWTMERERLINFIVNNGILMTSKENGKRYYCLFDETLSRLMGMNFVLCVQYNEDTMNYGSIVYVRAQDKFTLRMPKVQFDTRGRDNIGGTIDDFTY